MMWLREISAWLLSAGCVKVTCRWAEAWRNFPAHGGNRTKWVLCHSVQIAPSIRKHMTYHTRWTWTHTYTRPMCLYLWHKTLLSHAAEATMIPLTFHAQQCPHPSIASIIALCPPPTSMFEITWGWKRKWHRKPLNHRTIYLQDGHP